MLHEGHEEQLTKHVNGSSRLCVEIFGIVPKALANRPRRCRLRNREMFALPPPFSVPSPSRMKNLFRDLIKRSFPSEGA